MPFNNTQCQRGRHDAGASPRVIGVGEGGGVYDFHPCTRVARAECFE